MTGIARVLLILIIPSRKKVTSAHKQQRQQRQRSQIKALAQGSRTVEILVEVHVEKDTLSQCAASMMHLKFETLNG